jgi:phosphoadenosine phosphosulfate reductase
MKVSRLLTYENWNDAHINHLLDGFQDYFDVIKWAYKSYNNDEIVYACSFGAEGIVLIDLISKVNKQAHIVFLDTGLHFEETYKLINEVKAKYPTLNIELKKPDLTLKNQEEKYGAELWKQDANLCCYLRKIKPLESALGEKIAWISGLRRDEFTRKHVQYINQDNRFRAIKICPLIHWSWDDVWNYIKLNNLSYNVLHDQNYPSVGCKPCTNPVIDSKNLRSGRWIQSEKTECGLHIN